MPLRTIDIAENPSNSLEQPKDGMAGTNYFMENKEENFRLELKTDPEVIRRQAAWCGIESGQRVLDAGCGPGKATSVLHDIVRPGGQVVGIDYSVERIRHAVENYGQNDGIEFQIHDLREPLNGLGSFDLVWVRFVLEYYRAESPEIIRNLTECLNPGGRLCLLDLDNNCLNHYELPEVMSRMLNTVMDFMEEEYNFDPYAGRKLYTYLYDAGFQEIDVDLIPHHLLYGELLDKELFDWFKKVEIAVQKADGLFKSYPGGHRAFIKDFETFFRDPRRFTYTPMILCRGTKAHSL